MNTVTPASGVVLRRGPRRPIPPAVRVFGYSVRVFRSGIRRGYPRGPARHSLHSVLHNALCNAPLGVVDRQREPVTSRHVPLAPLFVYISLCIQGPRRSGVCVHVYINRNSGSNTILIPFFNNTIFMKLP